MQLSGLCYMHAPIVLQSYLVARSTQSNQAHIMLDLGSFIRQHRSTAELEDHIFRDRGGNSVAFLEQILMNQDGIKDTSAADMRDPYTGKMNTENVVRRLKSYGPALVARFSVYPGFRNKTQFVHRGSELLTQQTNPEGLHAMVLVGHRKTSSGEDRFLLQNWWKEKPFAEVDVAYLDQCKAGINFVTSEQTAIPTRFEQGTARHVEFELMLAERLPVEM